MRTILWLITVFASVLVTTPARALDRPARLAVDGAGNTYVVEQPAGVVVGNIVVINAAGQETGRICSTGSTIADPGYFSSVRDLAISPGGNLYVLDGVQRRLLEFSPAGAPLRAVNLPAIRPSAMAVLPGGQILLAESANGSIVRIDANGQSLASFPAFDLPVQANESFDIAVDGAGLLLVTDPANNRLIKFDISGNQPQMLGWLGGCNGGSDCVIAPGAAVGLSRGFCNGPVARCGMPTAIRTTGGFERPFFVAIDPAGGFYVADLIQGIQRFDASGALAMVLPRGTLVGQTGSGHIAVTGNGDLYVADTGNNRVNRFSLAGALLSVVGGGVTVRVIPGDTDTNRLPLTDQDPVKPAVVTITSLGYSGPVSLAASSCLRETQSPPYRSCASYGITTQFSSNTLNLTAGGTASTTLTLGASTQTTGRTLNGRYLVAVALLDAGGNPLATGQAGIQVALADKVGIVANPGLIKLFPGDPAKDIVLNLTNISGVAGSVTLETGISPAQAAGHFTHSLSPRNITTTTGTTVSTTPHLSVKAEGIARSGNLQVNVIAKRGSNRVGATDVDVQIDCQCRSTGPFVEPDILSVIQSTTDPQTGTSPSGQFTVHAAVASTGIPFVEIPGKLSPVENAAAWGFSPNEKFFLVATLNPSIPSQTYLRVFDLMAQGSEVQNITIEGCAQGNLACTPPPSFCFGGANCLSPKGNKPRLTIGHAGWGFSPDDKTLLLAKLDVAVFPTRQYSLIAYDLGHPHSAPIMNEQFNGGDAFWRFSPCGDMVMHFEQRAVTSSIVREATFWRLDGGQTPSHQVLAKALYADPTGNGAAPGARVAPASSLANGSRGDFDVALNNLVVTGSNRMDGFQSLQCRTR